MGAHGSTGACVGGAVRLGHVQGVSSGPATPELEHTGGEEMPATVWGVAWRLVSQDPMVGKLAGMVARSAQADLDR